MQRFEIIISFDTEQRFAIGRLEIINSKKIQETFTGH